MSGQLSYEVETRIYLKNPEEAYIELPFLKTILKHEITWETSTFGIGLYRSDHLLRVSDVVWNQQRKFFLGYKEQDIGTFCNIRLEYDEDITNGLADSTILRIISGASHAVSPDLVRPLLESLGHQPFMSFSGHSLLGQSGESGLKFKLMFCSVLQYPLLLEIEKAAGTISEAQTAEKEVAGFVKAHNWESRVVRKEPPALLYDVLNNLTNGY